MCACVFAWLVFVVLFGDGVIGSEVMRVISYTSVVVMDPKFACARVLLGRTYALIWIEVGREVVRRGESEAQLSDWRKGGERGICDSKH